jgi:hypothetical protein
MLSAVPVNGQQKTQVESVRRLAQLPNPWEYYPHGNPQVEKLLLGS